jgi:micrococcal nuclease
VRRSLLSLALAAALAGCDAADVERVAGSAGALEWRSGRVTKVVDGDNVHIRGLDNSRLIGIDAPETFGTAECFGPQARGVLRRLVRSSGFRVRWAYDAEPRDRYGRDLVYVRLRDGRLLNEALLEAGAAEVLSISPNTRYAARFERAERRARAARRGMWSACRGAGG